MHPEQKEFTRWVKKRHPEYFKGRIVVDVGSADINGNNRYLFNSFLSPCIYVGIDIFQAPNVNYVGRAHELLPCIHERIVELIPHGRYMRYDAERFKPDVIISTECLEHDEYWEDTLSEMFNAVKPGGLILITAAGEGRPEHGTTDNHSWCSPATNEYYKNITTEMIEEVLPARLFSTYYIGRNEKSKDIYMYGIKKVV